MTEDDPVPKAEGEWADQLAGVVLGTAVGEGLGLPREGPSRSRARKLFGNLPLRHRLLFGRGMVSGDAAHTCHGRPGTAPCTHDVDAFAHSLAWRPRFWLLGLLAGTGRATRRSVVNLWLGFYPWTSDVRSAGNGPAMWTAILGARLGRDQDRLRG